MKRTQIYLTDKEEEGILTIIKKNGGGTKAEHIRRALDDYIDKYNQIRIPINTNLDFNWIPQEKVGKRVRANYEHDPNFNKIGTITCAFPPSPGTIGDCSVYYRVKQDNGEFFNVKSFWVEFLKD